MTQKSILGIGNALVDILTLIPDDNILNELQLPKGGMQHVDAETSKKVSEYLKRYGSAMAAGGSTANTISGAAKLGVRTGYIGKVGRDEMGRLFEGEMVKTQVKPMMFTTDTPTGCANAIISKDGERTFATYLGAALELSPDDLKAETLDGWDLFYVEGYLIANRPLLDKALALAKEKGMTVAMDMASFNLVEANRDYLLGMVRDYIDILFANQEEARAFTGLDDPEEALRFMASMCQVAVVKVGSKGSLAQQGNEVVKVGPIPAKVVDTTGAGDLWASGFLSGYVKGESLEKCVRRGAVVASNIIEVLGAKMDEERWQKIQQSLKEL